jgi:Icc-related predicted phosphoesterase
MTQEKRKVRVAATGDLHFGRADHGIPLRPLFAEVASRADILVLCGDLTDTGEPEEARGLARVLSSVTIPIVAVLGNHDYEMGKPAEVRHILCDAGVKVLDGESCEIDGVGFAGVKGFAGGFGRGTLGPWGEDIVKKFVQEALGEALKLETALGRLRNERRVAILHYSPIEGTVAGEPKEIYPFLGCSRLEEPLSRYPVDAVFHGHAHHGTLEAKTLAGTPVYNVSINLLQRVFPEELPFRVIELEVAAVSRPQESPSLPAHPAPSSREDRAPPPARRP